MSTRTRIHGSDKGWGYIDSDGSLIIPFHFEHAEPHAEGLAPVIVAGKTGCIDRSGKWVIPPYFEDISFFKDGLASAKSQGKYGFINSGGEFIIPPIFEFVFDFCDERARALAANRTGYIDLNGKWVIPPVYQFAEDFHNGFALVCDPNDYEDKWFIDPSGKKAFGPFIGACSFSEGWAGVIDARGCCFIDTNGRPVLRLPSKVFAERFCENLSAAEDQSKKKIRFGYIHREGRWVIKPQFDFTFAFCNGLAKARIRDKHGFIDKEGNWVMPPQYDDLNDLSENRAAFERRARWGFLDSKGIVVIEPVYEVVQWFSDGLAAVCMEPVH
jgi:hypothetical protein